MQRRSYSPLSILPVIYTRDKKKEKMTARVIMTLSSTNAFITKTERILYTLNNIPHKKKPLFLFHILSFIVPRKNIGVPHLEENDRKKKSIYYIKHKSQRLPSGIMDNLQN